MVGAPFTKISLTGITRVIFFLFIALIAFVLPQFAQAQTVDSAQLSYPLPPEEDKPPTITENAFKSLVDECYGNKYAPIGTKCRAEADNGDILECEVRGLEGVGYYNCTISYLERKPPVAAWTDIEPKFWGEGLKGNTEDASGNPTAVNSSDPNDGCSFLDGNALTCAQSLAGKIGASILLIFVMALSAILGLVGGILNWVMLITVFQYSTYFGNSEGMLVAWSVLRDLGNIILLFGFIFIGLQTILNIGHFSVSKALPRLVIFAILINFSLFVSEAVVDVSNVFASTFYTQAGQVDCTDSMNMEKCANDGIAGKIMKEAGLSVIFSVNNAFKETWGAPNGSDMFFLYFCLIILVLIMIVVFIAAIILFIIRAVVLMLLLVTSPIGFVGMAIPQLEEFSSMWWKKLISNAIFAPVFLLMLLVGLKIMDGASGIFNASGASLTVALMQGSTGTGGIFILYSLIIGFMIAALMSAKSLGAVGASFAVSSAKNIVTYPLGVAGRMTAGAGANALKKSYDAHVAPSIRKVPGLGGMVDNTINAGLMKVKSSNFGTAARSFDDHEKHDDARKKEITTAATAAQNQSSLNAALALPATNPAEIETRNSEIEAILQRMSQAEIEQLAQLKKGGAATEQIARNLSPEKFAAIMKNKDISEGKRNEMRRQRFDPLKAAVAAAARPGATTAQVAAAKKAVRDMSTKDLEQYAQGDAQGFATLMATQTGAGALDDSLLSGDQHDALVKSGELSSMQRTGLKRTTKHARFEALFRSTAPTAGPVPAALKLSQLEPKQIAKLPEDVLTSNPIAWKLTPRMLMAIQKESSLSGAAYKDIGSKIMTGGLRETQDYISTGLGRGTWT